MYRIAPIITRFRKRSIFTREIFPSQVPVFYLGATRCQEVEGSKGSKMLILNFARRAQIASRDSRNDLANFPEIKDPRIFACEDRQASFNFSRYPLRLHSHLSSPPSFLPFGMHESISCAVACRKSNIHGVAIGTNANERGDSSISLLDNPSSVPLHSLIVLFSSLPFDSRRGG